MDTISIDSWRNIEILVTHQATEMTSILKPGMQREGVVPRVVTYTAFISVCGKSVESEQSLEVGNSLDE